MSKIIWHKEDLASLKEKLKDMSDIVITDDPSEVPHEMVGIVIEDRHLSKIKSILESILHEKSRIMVQTKDGYMQTYAKDIMYLEAFGDDIYMHMENEPSQLIKQPLYQLETLLGPYHFVRIGKSFIVNMMKIKFIRSGFNAKLDLELKNGTRLEVTRSFVKPFKVALGLSKKED